MSINQKKEEMKIQIVDNHERGDAMGFESRVAVHPSAHLLYEGRNNIFVRGKHVTIQFAL